MTILEAIAIFPEGWGWAAFYDPGSEPQFHVQVFEMIVPGQSLVDGGMIFRCGAPTVEGAFERAAQEFAKMSQRGTA